MDKHYFVLFQKQFISKLKELLKNPYCSTKVPSDHPICLKEQFNISCCITRLTPVSCLCRKFAAGATRLT